MNPKIETSSPNDFSKLNHLKQKTITPSIQAMENLKKFLEELQKQKKLPINS